jgi:hypothetical protein
MSKIDHGKLTKKLQAKRSGSNVTNDRRGNSIGKRHNKPKPDKRLATMEQRNFMRSLGIDFDVETCSVKRARLLIFNALEAKKTK